ncbi:guanylate kinase [Plasmodium sp. DRC-Itaito]|nr:guanylate kinase [Plasmodium sp. DRC-Itaito]
MNNICPLVICGPSGVGKGTLIKKLLNEFPNYFYFSVSCTTRKKREKEKEGVDYYFIDKNTFNDKLKKDDFLEYDNYANNFYGTLKSEYDKAKEQNKICLFEMNINGVKQLKKSTHIKNALYIFIKPPSTDILLSRLLTRNTENQEQIQKRMAQLNIELHEANLLNFNLSIINDDLTLTYQQLKNYLLNSYIHLNNHTNN